MKHSLLVLTMLGLAGCATNIPNDYSKMSPEQGKVAASDRNAGVMCVVARNATGTVVTMTAQLDRMSINSGSISIKPGSDCDTVITADPKPVAKAASAP